jgi:hypothetical protein
MNGRLQLRHNEQLFATKELALNYLSSQMIFGENRIALVAEPLVLKYGTDANNPNIILAIGSVGDGVTDNTNNKYFIIDTATMAADIATIKAETSGTTQSLQDIRNAIDALGTRVDGIDTKLITMQAAIDAEIARAEAAEAKIVTDMTELVATETTRAKEAEAALTVKVADTTSIHLVSTPSVTGNTITGNLKVSAIAGNQLLMQGDAVGGGLYYNVGLTYGQTTGVLTLTVNGSTASTINMPLQQILKSASYDSGNKQLVFVFTTQGSGDTTVTIPVVDLFDEYHAGLGLNLDTGRTFSIKFNTTATEPFLKLDSNGLALTGVQTAIDSGDTTERNRAMAAEQTEKDARTAADTTLQDNIHAEETRALAAEAKIASDLVVETTRAKDAESTLTTNLSTVSTKVDTNADRIATMRTDVNTLISGLSAETATRIADDGVLRDSISTEVTRAKGEESRLAELISGNTTAINNNKTDLQAEVNRATTAEAAAISSAKTYTDTSISAARSQTTTDIATALASANSHSDAQDTITRTEVARVDAKEIITVVTNEALTLSSNREANGNVTVTGGVVVSPDSTALTIKSNGLSVQLGMTYNNGVLTLTNPNNNNDVVATAQIAIGGVLQSVSYDAATFKLTLVFNTGGSTTTQVIDLSTLIRDWEVNNVKLVNGLHTAVHLYKEISTGGTGNLPSGTSQVYADVNIPATNPYGVVGYAPQNNLLAKHSDTVNGYLYVDGLAKFIKNNAGQDLETVLSTLRVDVSSVTADTTTMKSDITTLKGEVVSGGTYNNAILTLNKVNGNTLTVSGFTTIPTNLVTEAPTDGKTYGRKNGVWSDITAGLSGNLSGITNNISGNTLTLTDPQGHTVNIDLTPIITTAVNNAITEIFKTTTPHFIATDNDKQVKVTVDATAKTVTFGFGDDATFDSGTY